MLLTNVKAPGPLVLIMTPIYKPINLQLHSGLFSELCCMSNSPTFEILTVYSGNIIEYLKSDLDH